MRGRQLHHVQHGLDCEAIERWLRRPGPSTPTRRRAFEAHLAHCPACRQERFERLRLPGTAADPAEAAAPAPTIQRPPRDALFVRSVMARVRREPAPLVRRRRLERQRFAALAALVALLVLPALGLSPWRPVTHTGHDGDTAQPGNEIGATTTARAGEAPAPFTVLETKGTSAPASSLAGTTIRLDRWQTSFDDLDGVGERASHGWLPAVRHPGDGPEVLSF